MTSIRKWKCDICYHSEDYPMIATCGHTFGKNCITGKLRCFICNKLITGLIPNYYIASENNLTYIPPNGIINNTRTVLFRFIQIMKKNHKLIMFLLFIFFLHIIAYGFGNFFKDNYEEKVCDIERCNNIISTNGIVVDITINSTNISQQIFILINTKKNNDYCEYKNILCYLKDNTILVLDNYDILYEIYRISITLLLSIIDVLLLIGFIVNLCDGWR